MRISGFASGMDIDQIVKDLMTARRAPLNKLNQQKVSLEWKREQFREVSSKLVDLRNNKLFNYSLDSSINAKKVSTLVTGDAVTATANLGATAGAISVEVKGLASSAIARSADGVGNGIGAVDTSKTLKTLKTGGQLSYTADGSGNISFVINGSTIKVNENTDTLASMISRINGDTSAKVNAFLDSNTGKLSITNKETGKLSADGHISLSGDLLDNFDLTSKQAGVDASVVINGIDTTRKSNIFSINGVEVTLKAVSPAGEATTISVTESRDTDKIFETIKSFINDYNDVLSTVNGKLSEARYRNFDPLTTEQKAEMKEDDIKLWEQKAKSGLLRSDSTLEMMVSDMRLAIMTPVKINGADVYLSSFGIETGTWDQKGKLIIKDEAKLRKALDENPDDIYKLFTQQTTETDKKKKVLATTPDNGLFNRLTNVIMTSLDGLAEKAGTSKFSTDKDSTFMANSRIGEQLKGIDDKISNLTMRLSLVETRYYKQFTAMEVAMNRFNSQSASLFK